MRWADLRDDGVELVVEQTHRGSVLALHSLGGAVPAHAWQAARALGDYCLVGCTVAPAFEFAGFRLLSDDPQAQREWPCLLAEYPELL